MPNIQTFDSTGKLVETRAMTAEEQADFDRQQAAIAQRETVKLIVTDLQTEKARVQPIIDKANNQITAADTKDVARASKRIADAAIDLARLLTS